MCARCGEAESISHILFHCPHAMEVWNLGPWNTTMDVPLDARFLDTLRGSQSLTPLPPCGFTGNAFPWICWSLWTSRNVYLFENRSQSPKDTLGKEILALKEWEVTQPFKPQKTSRSTSLPRDQALSSMEVFCNTDAFWRKADKASGLAWIFFNQASKELYRGPLAQSFVSSPCMGEALAIREALLHAVSLNLPNICVRTDSQVLARAIHHKKYWF